MGLSPLIDLPVLPLRVSARVCEPVHLPTFAGSSIRGAFGAVLKELVCVERARERCPGCPLEASCAFPALFESRAPEGQTGFSGFGDLPRPYVIRCEPGERSLRPGETLWWDVTLIGRGIRELPYFVLAWRAMGEAGLGRGRGRFELDRVEALRLDGTPGTLVFNGKVRELTPPDRAIDGAQLAEWAESAAPAEALLRFVTPTRAKHRGQFVERP